jgi:hypothetical protein
VALAAFGLTLCRRGLILSDEGYILLQALDLASGKVPYRDMDAFVSPGVWLLLAGLFRVFEPSVWLSRVAIWVCWLASAWLAARCVAALAGARWVPALLAAWAVCTLWAFPAWTWSFYSPYAVLFALGALERLLAWRASGRGRELVWVGALLGLALAFKQNYGGLALAGAALGGAAIRLEAERSARALLAALPGASARVALGLGAVVLPLLAWFAWHGALADAFHALVLHPFGGFLGQHDIPYLPVTELFERDRMGGLGRLTYGSYGLTHTALRFNWPAPLVRGAEILHVALYWIAPLVFATAAALVAASLRTPRFDGGLAAALAVCGLLFLGVFPRADYNHLLNVYQGVLVVGVVVLARLAERAAALRRPLWRAARGAGLALFGLYAAIALYWYVDILGSLDSELEQRRGGVLVSLESKQMLDFEVRALRENSRPGEAVLTLPGLAMLNFLAERPMPSRYYNHYAVHIAHDQGAGVVEGLEARRVQLVLADYNGFFSEIVGLREYAPRLVEHLRRYFAPLFSVAIDDHLFLRRRAQPLPDRALRNVLDDCDFGPFDWRARGVQQHLLFDMLYHPLQSGPQLLRRQAETLCRVAVPPQATLAFALGYRQPTQVAPDTELVAELWLRRLGHPEESLARIYREVLHPVPLLDWRSPPHAERRLDLSAWGGQEVLLLLRTLYAGEVGMNILDFKGFAMVWQDPQLEYPRHGG